VDSYFVYVSAGRHLWRFVYFAKAAATGTDAISQAVVEARTMGNDGIGGYLAVPLSACTTETVDEATVDLLPPL
jgi:hypothetical protein